MAKAICWRSGHIEIVEDDHSDAFALVLAEDQPKERLEKAISAFARLAYDNVTWLVPGIPEAKDDDAALEAAIRFTNELTDRLEG